ncbi:MAG: hypothetical protein ACM3U2_08155, partial [Deltaproteobacteria bacterium]
MPYLRITPDDFDFLSVVGGFLRSLSVREADRGARGSRPATALKSRHDSLRWWNNRHCGSLLIVLPNSTCPAGVYRIVSTTSADLAAKIKAAKERLDAHVRETVEWHFNPATGSPFWLEKAKTLGFDPRKDVHGFEDLKKFPEFEDEWLRGGPVQRWIPQG